jgi:hypothetical protein
MQLQRSRTANPQVSDPQRRPSPNRAEVRYHLDQLGDSTSQAIAVGEPLIVDAERILGPDPLDTLTSRDNLANAYVEASRSAEAIPLHEQT